jgi:hypothetical protein
MMTKAEFIRAMGGEEKMRERGQTAVPCACGHECCQGWDVEVAES